MPESTWGLALNGARARIVRNLEDRHDERGIPEELAVEVKPHHLRDVMSDKPGRSFSSGSSARSAMEYASDPVEEEKRAFCDEVLELIGAHLKAKDFDRLVVAASPDMMGLLRDSRDRAVADATVREATKDLTHENAKRLRHLMQEMVPSRLA